jgi:hypothetical protein
MSNKKSSVSGAIRTRAFEEIFAPREMVFHALVSSK